MIGWRIEDSDEFWRDTNFPPLVQYGVLAHKKGGATDIYASPVSIILRLDRMDTNYLAFVDATVLTTDSMTEYPVIYIKFFLRTGEDEYEPAALVITSDKRFYILIDGAFYSLVCSDLQGKRYELLCYDY